jgi:hypothetical protein
MPHGERVGVEEGKSRLVMGKPAEGIGTSKYFTALPYSRPCAGS